MELTQEQMNQQKELCKALLAIYRKGYNKGLYDMNRETGEMNDEWVDERKKTSIELPQDEMWELIEIFVYKYKEYETVKVEILPIKD